MCPCRERTRAPPPLSVPLSQVQELLVPALRRAVAAFFGPEPDQSDSYGRMVSARAFGRVRQLLEDARCCSHTQVHTLSASGKAEGEGELYLCPTLVTGCSGAEAVMQEEIFGPVLPIVAVPDLQAAIAFINAREKPLALYVFSAERSMVDRVIEETTSGGVCANDTMMHCGVPDLPFGGVGHSGMGMYHGQQSFDTFSHRKSVLLKVSPSPAHACRLTPAAHPGSQPGVCEQSALPAVQ